MSIIPFAHQRNMLIMPPQQSSCRITVGFINVQECDKVKERDTNMPPPRLTPDIIAAAIEGFESQKRKIDGQIAELRAMLPGGSVETAAAPTRKRRKMSADARARIAAAQKARWAKQRGESEPAPAEPQQPKRKLSAAGRRNIVAALKKRWALKRAGAAGRAKPVAKKAAPKKTAGVKKAAVKAAPARAAKKTTAAKTPMAARIPVDAIAE